MDSTQEYTLALIVSWIALSLAAPSKAFPFQILADDKTSLCYYEGHNYTANSSFITNDCSMQCYCMGSGATSCMELCSPPPQGVCPPGMVTKEEREKVGPTDRNCFCKKKYCAAAFCYTDKYEKYKIGESFQRGNCSETCTCTEEGHFLCSPSCPQLKCPRGYRLKNTRRIKVILGCKCQSQRCVKKRRRRVCKVNGRIYTKGRHFVTDSCQSKCRCRRNGSVRCRPMCPKVVSPKCGANERMTERQVPILHPRKRCYCTKKMCIPNTKTFHPTFKPKPKPTKHNNCRVSNRTLVPGQQLMSEDCSERCRCTLSGYLVCVPLCVRLPVACLSNEERVLIKRPVPGSKCSCTRVVCRPRTDLVKKENECRVDGHAFAQGIKYIDKNCTKICTCNSLNAAECKPLCPVSTSYCPTAYTHTRKVRVSFASWCSCSINECLLFEDNQTDIREH